MSALLRSATLRTAGLHRASCDPLCKMQKYIILFFLYLVFITIAVFWLLIYVIYHFNFTIHDNLNNVTSLELIITMYTGFIITLSFAVPSLYNVIIQLLLDI